MLFNRCASVLLLLLIFQLGACSSGGVSPVGTGGESPELFTISKEGRFAPEECAERNLSGRVIMLESKYCAHCKATLPLFRDACRERGVEPLVLDLSEEESLEQATGEFGVTVQYTPTFLFDCRYVIGERSKEEYLALLDGMEGDLDG